MEIWRLATCGHGLHRSSSLDSRLASCVAAEGSASNCRPKNDTEDGGTLLSNQVTL